jgi:cytoskeletal protein RodZ
VKIFYFYHSLLAILLILAIVALIRGAKHQKLSQSKSASQQTQTPQPHSNVNAEKRADQEETASTEQAATKKPPSPINPGQPGYLVCIPFNSASWSGAFRPAVPLIPAGGHRSEATLEFFS